MKLMTPTPDSTSSRPTVLLKATYRNGNPHKAHMLSTSTFHCELSIYIYIDRYVHTHIDMKVYVCAYSSLQCVIFCKIIYIYIYHISYIIYHISYTTYHIPYIIYI